MEEIMVTAEMVGMSTARLARIRPVLEKHIGADKMSGAVTLLMRRGELVNQEYLGLMDRENNKPMRPDSIFRIYSMTKPIICVALMTLYEQGYFQLYDPVSKFIPAFSRLKVYAGGDDSGDELTTLEREVMVRDLLTHTSGLSYHFLEYGRVEEMYREQGVSSEKPLAEFVADLMKLPLAFQPGTAFRYGYSHDVVAHLIEIMSDQPLDTYLHENLFAPLEMVDTGFYVPQESLDRFTAMYGSGKVGDPDMTATQWFGEAIAGVNKLLADPADCLESAPHNVFRGGHGLVSTAHDYLRFCKMMINMGKLDGSRVLGRKTVELMTTNHLAPELLPYEIGDIYSPGQGYGLGFSVVVDVGQSQTIGSIGDFAWGGAASTSFWIDPVEDFIGIQMAQFQPSGHHLIGADFRVMAYQAIDD
jgi:CubicO group peptidase (beta-lactamase class C family)